MGTYRRITSVRNSYAMGLPSPTPFVDSAVKSIKFGVNFAVGGAGVLYTYSLPPLLTQVDTFERLLRSGVYTPAALAGSVALISIAGNDYRAANYTQGELVVLIQQVVEGISLAIRRLYDLGLRKMLVANLGPLGCTPSSTIFLGYSACYTNSDPLIAYHNHLLQDAVASLNALPSADLIILDENKAFTYVRNNSAKYGVTERLAPCCRPLVLSATVFCGDHDSQGKPLYSLCDDPTLYFYWDSDHPVESTWKDVVDLFLNEPGFVLGAPTLRKWLQESALEPALPPDYAAPGTPIGPGAAGQLTTAYEALVSDVNYSESLGLLQAINLEKYLDNDPEQVVTAFLPNNEAYYSVASGFINSIFAHDQELWLVSYHVVHGYFDSATLAATSSQTLTTISGLPLPINSSSVGVSVGQDAAMVVRPNLYEVKGQVVVHGIDRLLVPPGLVGM